MPRPTSTLQRLLLPLLLFAPLLLCAPLPLQAEPSKCPHGAYTAIVFVVTNYVAHAFTVVRFPGDTNKDIVYRQATALFAPYIGYLYALAKILKVLDSDRGDALREACRGGAIVHLARNEMWWPRAGDRVLARVANRKAGSIQRGGHVVGQCRIEIRSLRLDKPRPVPVMLGQYDQIHKIVHEGGKFVIPRGYTVQNCPDNVLPQRHDRIPTEEVGLVDQTQDQTPLVLQQGGAPPPRAHREIKDDASYANYTVPVESELLLAESIIALVQLIFAIASTSLSARDTVEKYGYAAYSLTVLPFAAMSISNGLANATSRNYPLRYFAKTLEMSEARRRIENKEDVFEGFAGRLPQIEPEEESYWIRGTPGNGVAWVKFEVASESGRIAVRMKNPNDEQEYLEGWVAEEGPGNQPPQTETLTIEVEPNRDFKRREESHLISIILGVLVALILYLVPLAIAGALSRFDKKNSTLFQRMAVGIWFWFQGAGIVVVQAFNYFRGVDCMGHASKSEYRFYMWPLIGVLGGAGVMLYVVVGMQMAAIGVCCA